MVSDIRRVCVLLALPLLACASSVESVPEQPAENSCKILFIGNSLTFYNNLPGMVKQLAEATGRSVFIDASTIGGATLADHAVNASTLSKIQQQEWDYAILQQAIMAVAFPEIYPELSWPIESLADAISENNTETKVLYFLDYSMRNGLFWLGEYYTYDASQQMLYDGTLELAEQLELAIAPVGWAWNAVVRDRPDIDLYASDEGHPSYLGSYLSAAVYFATIFQEAVSTNSYTAGIDDETAGFLQDVATHMVLDSLSLWRLPPATGSCASF